MQTKNIIKQIEANCDICRKKTTQNLFFYEEQMLRYFEEKAKYNNKEIEEKPTYPNYYRECSVCKSISYEITK